MAKRGRIYKWRKGSSFKVEAQVAGELLEDLREKNGGFLDKEDVWKAAQDPDSPIHEEFEWDVDKAAQAHWKSRAGDMIRHLAVVRILDTPPEEGMPAFINVVIQTDDDDKRRGYVTGTQVLSDADLHQQAIDQALKLLKGLEARYNAIVELDDIWKAIRKAEKKRNSYKKK